MVDFKIMLGSWEGNINKSVDEWKHVELLLCACAIIIFLTIRDCRITSAQRIRASAQQPQQKDEGRALFWDGKKQKLPSGMNLQADLCLSGQICALAMGRAWLDGHFQVHIVPQGRSGNGPLLADNDYRFLVQECGSITVHMRRAPVLRVAVWWNKTTAVLYT
jgi:hypothetical protein